MLTKTLEGKWLRMKYKIIEIIRVHDSRRIRPSVAYGKSFRQQQTKPSFTNNHFDKSMIKIVCNK